jgi:cobalamin biosynthesis protein CobW
MISRHVRRHHDGADDHEHDDFDSIVVDLPEVTDHRGPFGPAIVRLAEELNILRVKGHVAVAGKPMRMLVQAVGARVRHAVRPALGHGPAPVATGGDRGT